MRRVLQFVALEDRTVPATFTVTSFSDLAPTGFDPASGQIGAGGPITLRSAILAANATPGADTIIAPAGTYTLTITGADEDAGLTGDLDVTDDTTFQMTGAVVDGSGLGDRLLDVLGGTVSITGGTFQNGTLTTNGGFTVGQGGGIHSTGALTLTGVTVTGNAVVGITNASGSGNPVQGGGVWANNQLTVTNSLIANNKITGGAGTPDLPGGDAQGGGLYFDNGTLTVTATRVTGNAATGGNTSGNNEGTIVGYAYGGGIDVEGASATLTNVRADGNTATAGTLLDARVGSSSDGGNAFGGGLHTNDTNLTLSASTFDGNTARGGDGLLQNGNGFVGTGGFAFGGGVSLQGSSNSLSVQNTTLSGNLAVGGSGTNGAVATNTAIRGQAFGGGLYYGANGSITGGNRIANVTATNNEVQAGGGADAIVTDGGGLYRDGNADTTVQSSIVAGNRAAVNRDVGFNANNSVPDFASGGSNLIGVGDGSGSFINGTNNDQVGTAAAPLDPLLTPLGYFGGPGTAMVHALNIGSTARDGDFNKAFAADERGFTRPVGAQGDIGAFEVQVPSTLTLTPPAGGVVAQGQPFTVTGSVTDARFQPTGTVQLIVNGVPGPTAALDASGNFSITTTAAATGPLTLSFTYSGDAAYLSAASGESTIFVQAASTTALTVTPNPAFEGQTITLSAAVTSSDPTIPVTGTVQFSVNGSPVGSPVTVDASGQASVAVPPGLVAGTYPVTAAFTSGDSALADSSATGSLVVLSRTTTTTVGVSPNPVFATDPVFFTSTVTGAAGGPTPTGTVTFFLDGNAVGTGTLDGTGTATFTLTAGVDVGDGNYAVTAGYNGDANYASSASPATTLTVVPLPTNTTLSAAPTPATLGTAVTLTATVAFAPTNPMGAVGLRPTVPGGSVNFFNGTTLLGSAPLTNGVATLTTTALPVGTNTVTAVFVPPSPNFAASSGSATATVTALPRSNEIFAVGSGYGILGSLVKVYDPDGNELRTLMPFGPDYWCGVVVATGDVTGDGVEDLVVTAPLGAAARVVLYDGVTFNVLANFYAYDPNFGGGASLAVGDLTGDGVAEIVTGAGPGGGPAVNVYSFANGGMRLVNSFFAYEPTTRSGVTVSVSGGLLATGTNFTGGPAVHVYSGPGTALVDSFFAFDPNSRNGVNVALSFDGTRTILTAANAAGDSPMVKVFDATTGAQIGGSSLVYEATYLGGVTVTNVRTPGGESRTVFGTGLGGGPRVRILGPGGTVVKDFFAFDPDFRGGVFVG